MKLKETAGVELLWGDNEGQYREAIATVNDNGGVLGRMIDPVFVYVDPLSETGYQEACVQLTQDEEVFAVLGFLRPAEGALCYTETGDTPFVGYLSDITSDVFERSVLPLVTSNPLPERLDAALVDVVDDTGAFEGKTIAVLGRTEERNQLIADELTGRGYEVADVGGHELAERRCRGRRRRARHRDRALVVTRRRLRRRHRRSGPPARGRQSRRLRKRTGQPTSVRSCRSAGSSRVRPRPRSPAPSWCRSRRSN